MKKSLFLGAVLAVGTLAMTIPTFAANGSWKEDNTGYKYQFSDGTFAYSSWLSLDDKWYHIDSSGYMQKGWLKDGDDWYYLDTDNGQMQEGWSKINNKWYYFEESGLFKKGWIEYKGLWYYLDANGEMVTNTTIDGFNINQDGVWVQ